MKEQLERFFAKMHARRNETLNNVPGVLAPFINKPDLTMIYQYLYQHQHHVRTKLLANHGVVRLGKEETGLPRTLNIISDQNGEFMLMLETKSKLAHGTKDPSTSVKSGATKRGKIVYRIDCSVPEPWMNMGVKKKTQAELEDEIEEAHLSQTLAAGPRGELINQSLLGQSFYKLDKKSNQYFNNISLYSPLALGTLDNTIKLSEENKEQIILQLLQAIKIIHDRGFAHQDLKELNILVFRNANGNGNGNGNYSIKLTDFGSTTRLVNPKWLIGSVPGYESPEISLAAADPLLGQLYRYLHYLGVYSHGKQVYESLRQQDPLLTPTCPKAKSYLQPSQSNDMWALGILAFKILKGRNMSALTRKEDLEFINQHPLLKGLLAPKREDRFTINQAIYVHTAASQRQREAKAREEKLRHEQEQKAREEKVRREQMQNARRENDVNSHRVNNAIVPKENNVNAGRENNVNARRENNVNAGRENNVNAPRANNVNAPRVNNVNAAQQQREILERARIQAQRQAWLREQGELRNEIDGLTHLIHAGFIELNPLLVEKRATLAAVTRHLGFNPEPPIQRNNLQENILNEIRRLQTQQRDLAEEVHRLNDLRRNVPEINPLYQNKQEALAQIDIALEIQNNRARLVR